jgi:hypothetical protein
MGILAMKRSFYAAFRRKTKKQNADAPFLGVLGFSGETVATGEEASAAELSPFGDSLDMFFVRPRLHFLFL